MTALFTLAQSRAGHTSTPLTVPNQGRTGFALLSGTDTGVLFTNRLSVQRYTTNQILLNGSGIAAGDIDHDGWCDLYFCGLDGPNQLYRNLGQWRFEEITKQAGVDLPDLDATGAAFGDLDGDGDLDLVVNSIGGGAYLFANNGHGRFTPVPPVLNLGKGGTTLTLADIDGDGDLDLYLANYRTVTIRDQPNTQLQISQVNGQMVVLAVNGRPATEPDLAGRFTLAPNGKIIEHGEVDVLYRNDGSFKFTACSWTDGTFLDEDGLPLKDPPHDWGLTAMFRDLNGDAAPDLYVCNDFAEPDRLWINNGAGKFRALPRLNLRTTSLYSMGVDAADINRDGAVDIFVLDMLSRDRRRSLNQLGDVLPPLYEPGQIENRPQYSRNTLLLNRGDLTFAEIGRLSGLEASDWSWSPIFLDVDLDGFEDLLIATGNERDSMNIDITEHLQAQSKSRNLSALQQLKLRNQMPRYPTPKLIFRNRGDLTFEEMGAAWGFGQVGVAQGMALADLDNDGDLDVAVNELNHVAGLYRNESTAPRLAVRAKCPTPNTHGIGAKINVLGGPVPQSQEITCGGRYLSSDEPLRVFATGSITNRLTIEITWRNGQKSVIREALPNRVYFMDETAVDVPSPTPRRPDSPAPAPLTSPFFEDASAMLGHVHEDEPFDDFSVQALLPRRLSHLGPGVSWHDLDADGWDDLIIGGGKGGQIAVYHNNQGRALTRNTEPLLDRALPRDQTTIIGMNATILTGAANYEDGSTNGGCVRVYDTRRKASGDSILGERFSRGPLALADVDNDGDLDLFVGGRCVPGRYPEPASSLLMRNDGGKLVLATRWDKLGLVSGAVFADLDGDGDDDLVLACEWGPLRILRNTGGKFETWNPPLLRPVPGLQSATLDDLTGFWNGIATGDLDGDGRLDLIASNWGWNTPYRVSPSNTVRIYYDDFDGNGVLDIIEAQTDLATGLEVPLRGLKEVGPAIPFVQEKMKTCEAYALARLDQIFGTRLQRAPRAEAKILSSMVFLNCHDGFEPVELPVEAQFAPAFGICAGDLDGDGAEDLFLSQNFFAVTRETPRHDAGRGLWLKGDGRGTLKAVPGHESGILGYGEQRGCAVGDYDADGRLDLVVTQNSQQTKLYHNIRAQPGLRVRLRGPPGNPNAIGSQIRLRYDSGESPVREIQAGSGYWSENSAVQVFGLTSVPTHIWIRWPGGKTSLTQIPPGAKEIAITTDGQIQLN